MNKTTYKKIAAGVAAVFSLLTIVEGAQVLLGITRPDYVVLTPLLVYNVTMGVIGVFVGVALWINNRWSLKLTTIVVAAHLIVLLTVGVIYLLSGAVASHSVNRNKSNINQYI
ncbi:MAG: hypothetical protein FD122_1318 [Stygiobacter sp.]|nr:MAG: hypothetical protein FD122_1318 [Stygiobacter sp.]